MSIIFASKYFFLKVIKSIFDNLLALVLLIILAIPMFIIWMITTLDTGQNGLFIHERIGKGGKPFKMYKFRTLKGTYDNPITTEQTHQFSKSGKFLMKYKLDELPQLFNILNQTMSFVGPRPDVAGYADQLEGDDRVILSVKPGITGPAQIKYRDEASLLARAENPMELNDQMLWPDKVKINKDYIKNWSLKKDFQILWRTLF